MNDIDKERIYATISADVVSSTALGTDGLKKIRSTVESFLLDMEKMVPDSWGRLTRGDFIECVIPNPLYALRLALMLKLTLKALKVNNSNSRFDTYGARIAIGIASMKTVDRELDIMDGNAIYLSGRKIDKKEPISKGTLSLNMDDAIRDNNLSTVCVLIDALCNKMTKKQAEVVYYKLLNKREEEISNILGIKQATVNRHSTLACWYAVEQSVKVFETTIGNL